MNGWKEGRIDQCNKILRFLDSSVPVVLPSYTLWQATPAHSPSPYFQHSCNVPSFHADVLSSTHVYQVALNHHESHLLQLQVLFTLLLTCSFYQFAQHLFHTCIFPPFFFQSLNNFFFPFSK